MTELAPNVIDALAMMLPTKMLDIPTVALEPNAHQILSGLAPLISTIAE
jgi:hypothetical protein